MSRHLRGRCALVVAISLAAACTGSGVSGSAVVLPQFEILSELPEVRLGMTVGELRALRPAVATVPRTGVREEIRGDTVWYILDNPPGREGEEDGDQLAPIARSRVVGVANTRRMQSEAAADSLARDWVSRLGPPDECRVYHYRDVTNEAAVYRGANREVYVTKRPPSRVARGGGAVDLAAGVQLLIAAPETRAVPVAPRVERVDCARLF